MEILKKFIDGIKNLDNVHAELKEFDGIDPTIDITFNNMSSNIPIIKTIHSVYKTGINLRDRKLMLNVIRFFNKLYNNIENQEDKDKILKRFEKNSTKRIKETEIMLLILDKQIKDEKVDYFGNLYYLLLNEKLNINQYSIYVEMLDNIFVYDLKKLIKDYNYIVQNQYLATYEGDTRTINHIVAKSDSSIRLENIGLLGTTKSQYLGILGEVEDYYLTEEGFWFCHSILNDKRIIIIEDGKYVTRVEIEKG